MQKTVISVLLDMSNFYDRTNLQKLAERWLMSKYPATHAASAMKIYCGTRILEAEGEASRQKETLKLLWRPRSTRKRPSKGPYQCCPDSHPSIPLHQRISGGGQLAAF